MGQFGADGRVGGDGAVDGAAGVALVEGVLQATGRGYRTKRFHESHFPSKHTSLPSRVATNSLSPAALVPL